MEKIYISIFLHPSLNQLKQYLQPTVLAMAITTAIAKAKTIAKATSEGKILAKAIAELQMISIIIGKFI